MMRYRGNTISALGGGGEVLNIGEIQLVHRGMFSTSERYHEYIGGIT